MYPKCWDSYNVSASDGFIELGTPKKYACTLVWLYDTSRSIWIGPNGSACLSGTKEEVVKYVETFKYILVNRYAR